MSGQVQITKAQHFWLIAGAIPFLLSFLVLGVSFSTGALTAFSVGWPILQIFGYAMTLRMAKGDAAHDLVKVQVVLHYIALVLLITLLVRAS
ncbi:MAG: pyridoxal phosphate biosynthetic protein [Citromicrobium sp.]|mgnify:FL=1|jgi:hypothetical protein|nr:pyridoxal phosphate biosynthetic protein [Citromicrobium sp.]MAO96103.1 pyridoxal phosphate biosynthetic protein [Citromicrobium sp.]MBT46793.1 pyridoxal phosphate biosynthetic protein [Citromicrobium sp.]|tara:strand:- start:306 stop:581 length:276 start_codon:yes stop_codon:yes gene_type:complete